MIRRELRAAIYAGEVPFTSVRSSFRGGQYDVGNWRYRAAQCQDLPGVLVRELLRRADQFDETEDYAKGTHYVAAHVKELRAAHIHHAYDEAELKRTASRCARLARSLPTLPERQDVARRQGLEPPAPDPRTASLASQMARLGCERWWRRGLRRAWTRRAEEALRSMGLICRRRAGFCSDGALAWRRMSQASAARFLSRYALENESGEQLELLAVAAHSLANPAIRRGELMLRVRGFEEIAADMGHAARFFTLTAPSAFHRMLATGEENPRWAAGSGVREAQAWLRRQWARVRAHLARLSIPIYGVRVAEPHHDGTPHWHLLLFIPAARAADVERIVRAHWLAEYAEEPGAKRHRVTCEAIRKDKGSAVGYIAKYIAKNIDANGQMASDVCEETALPAAAAAERVRAWASVHGIRQFQQIGGPAVGLWRECRRVRDGHEDPDIDRAVRAADAGDWRGFCRALGPFFQREKVIRLEKELFGDLNAYGELRAPRITGIRSGSAFAATRPHLWRLKPCSSSPSLSDSSSASALLSRAFASATNSAPAADPPPPPIRWSTVRRSRSTAPCSSASATSGPVASLAPSRGTATSRASAIPPTGGTMTASRAGTEDLSSSFSAAPSRRLGPVAITVRAAPSPAGSAAKRPRVAPMADHNAPVPDWMWHLLRSG